MLSTPCSKRYAFALALLIGAKLPSVLASVTYLPMSFFFDWNPPGTTFPVPVTPQCETIHIVWQRGTATGPNPVPPYYLQVYTSLFLVPMVIPVGTTLSYDWAVPFPPGTMYQICMFDSNGNTGGCQDTYTMIPASNGVATCANATIPQQLEVEGTVANGPISRYGWIEQCTDIQVTAKNGTPPYTFTIAPALHPPYNITGPGPTFNWTVDLSWASPFFISLADSTGSMWSHGLLHSGGGPEAASACLSGNSTDKKSGSTVAPAAAAGAGIGGLILGALLGLGAMFLFTRKKIKQLESENLIDLSGDYASGHHGSANGRVTVFSDSSRYYPVPSNPMGLLDNSLGSSNPGGATSLQQRPSRTDGGHGNPLDYHIEPFVLPTEEGRLQPPAPTGNTRRPSSMDPNRPDNKIYVVHHDGNAAPVTIYHEDGTEVVELPPRYLEGSSSPPPNQPSRGQPSSSHAPSGSADGGFDVRSDITGTTRTTETQDGIPGFLQQQRKPVTARKPPRDIAYTRTSQE